MEFDGEDDHVHLLVNYPPKVAVSALVNSLKGVSSRLLRQKNYPSISQKLWGGALWSPSYFAGSCGGAPGQTLIGNRSSLVANALSEQHSPGKGTIAGIIHNAIVTERGNGSTICRHQPGNIASNQAV